jgi:hypothetical protein
MTALGLILNTVLAAVRAVSGSLLQSRPELVPINRASIGRAGAG